MMNGKVPMTIRTTLDHSLNPKTMKRICNNAKGGIIDKTATNCARKLRPNGKIPISNPMINPKLADIPMPSAKRF